jgi:CO dehydrogenase/acetyl-CoA synthase beta subunit
MSTLTTDQKGQMALLKVQMAAARKGAVVVLPTIPVRYDAILDYQGKLYRAQVKYADGKSQRSQGAVRLDLRRRKKCYMANEIDVVLVYVPQVDGICWFNPEVFESKSLLHLRIAPAKNGQTNGCRMIDEFVW